MRRKLSHLFTWQCRPMNTNHSTQVQWQQRSNDECGSRTAYDFDREQWSRQMKFASMDCIMDPNISRPSLYSFRGLKIRAKQLITFRKLKERRPDYRENHLQALFVQFKSLSKSRNTEDIKLLTRVTTHNEAARIAKEVQKASHDDISKRSWKSLRL